jgi:hypothetical protein
MSGLQNSALHPAGSGESVYNLRCSLLSAMVIMFTASSGVNNAIFAPHIFWRRSVLHQNKRRFFPEHHKPIGIRNGDAVCFL